MTTSSQDTEITLGTGKLLVLFFFLVGICALFFALGYSLGRKTEPMMAAASAASTPQPTAATGKANSGSAAAQPMTFYKNVEQSQANPQLAPATDTKTDTNATGANTNPAQTAVAPPANTPDPMTTLPTSGYFVQVAAVTKQEDAESLVEALRRRTIRRSSLPRLRTSCFACNSGRMPT